MPETPLAQSARNVLYVQSSICVWRLIFCFLVILNKYCIQFYRFYILNLEKECHAAFVKGDKKKTTDSFIITLRFTLLLFYFISLDLKLINILLNFKLCSNSTYTQTYEAGEELMYSYHLSFLYHL